MSYSRYSGSVWYTFWAVAPYGVAEDRDNALFEICEVLQVTAGQIRQDVDAAVKLVVDSPYCPFIGPDDVAELRAYMLEFLADVDKKYPEPGKAVI